MEDSFLILFLLVFISVGYFLNKTLLKRISTRLSTLSDDRRNYNGVELIQQCDKDNHTIKYLENTVKLSDSYYSPSNNTYHLSTNSTEYNSASIITSLYLLLLKFNIESKKSNLLKKILINISIVLNFIGNIIILAFLFLLFYDYSNYIYVVITTYVLLAIFLFYQTSNSKLFLFFLNRKKLKEAFLNMSPAITKEDINNTFLLIQDIRRHMLFTLPFQPILVIVYLVGTFVPKKKTN